MANIKTVFKLVADNKTKRAFNEVDKSLAGAQKGIANLTGKIAGLVGVAGMGLMIKTQLEAAKGTVVWSKALGVNVETLSAWQYAAKEMNIEGEKMADVMKDVSEKIGDAFRNNAGEAKEVMEGLNLSMADMVQLSPDQQILAIAGALDKVGTQAEKIQIMEGMGSDLSKMLPLLDDNAAGLHALMEEGRAAGAVMDEAQAKGMTAMNDTMRKIDASNMALQKSFTLAFGDSLASSVSYLSTTAIPAFAFMAERIGLIETNLASLDEMGARVRITALTEDITGLNEQIKNVEESPWVGGQMKVMRLADMRKEAAELNAELEPLKARLAAIMAPPPQLDGGSGMPAVGAFVPSEAGGDDKAAAAAVKDQERLAQQFERLKVSMMNEQDALRFHLEEKQTLIDDAFFAGDATHLERNELTAQIELEHQQKITAITEEETQKRADANEAANAIIMASEQQTTNVMLSLGVALASGSSKAQKAMMVITAMVGASSTIASSLVEAGRIKAVYATLGPAGIAAGEALAAKAVVMGKVRAGLIIGTAAVNGARELGGSVMPSNSYLVGERGPEIFSPNSGGNITANNQIGGGGDSIVFAPSLGLLDADATRPQIEKIFNTMWNMFADRMRENSQSFVQG